MKFISSTQATVALQVSADDVRPIHGVMTRDLIATITDKYQFHVFPQLPPGLPPQALPVMVFQSGVCVGGEDQYPIMNLTITPAGTTITAYDAEACDIILNDYIDLLDDILKYRIKDAPKQLFYQSHVVVELDPALEKLISQFSMIEKILDAEMPRSEYPFKIKRLSFGYGDPIMGVVFPQGPVQIEQGDFQIERRAKEPYARNRYYCTAPTRTSDHIRLLELIDRSLRD